MAMDETPGSITEPQFKYICGLVESKDLSSLDEREILFLTGDATNNHNNYLRMSKKQAHNAIGKLVELPKKPAPAAEPKVQLSLGTESVKPVDTTQPGWLTQVNENSASTVPDPPDAGYYFVVDPTSNPPGKESFFRVSKPNEHSRWHGYTFLAIQASDDFYAIKDKARKEAIYAEILKDPINAMNEYGIRLGRCGVCNRTLTDRDSRLRGIGPICAARLDAVPTQEDVDLLTALGMINPEG